MVQSPHEGSLDAAGIADAPSSQGAYRLWLAGRVLFVGVTTGMQTLRSELKRHWRGDFGPRTQAATHFDCLVGDSPAQVQERYVELYLNSGLREGASGRRRPAA